MRKIKLISEQYIKDFSDVMENVEDQFLGMHILTAQDVELRYILGDGLYNEILDEYTNWAGNPGTDINVYVSTKNQFLRNQFIKDILLFYSLYRSRFSLKYKLTNKGNVEQSSSYSTSVFSMAEFEDHKNTAESYVSRMLDYLQNNLDTYPLYSTFIGGDCGTEGSAFDSGWYLGEEL